MGYALTDLLPANTYGDLLKVSNDGEGLTTTLTSVGDGMGNDSPMELATNAVNFNRTGGSTFQLDGVALTASVSALNAAGGANTASYVVATAEGDLPNERVLTGTGSEIAVTDNGAGSTITLSLPNALNFTGKTITGGTFTGITVLSSNYQADDGSAALPSFSFENDPDTGMYRAGTNTLGLSAAGALQAQINGVASATRYVTLSGSNGGTPTISTSAGSLALAAAGGSTQVVINNTASANRTIALTGGNSSSPTISVEGGTNTGIIITALGNESIYFRNSTGGQSARFGAAATIGNAIGVSGAANGSPPSIRSESASGVDTNIGLNFSTTGTGDYAFLTGTSNYTQFGITNTTSAVNYFQLTGGTSGQGTAFLGVTGSGSAISAAYTTKGAGAHQFYTGGAGGPATGVEQVRISHLASAVDYWQFSGGATASPGVITCTASGSDSNITQRFLPKGTGEFQITVSNINAFRVDSGASLYLGGGGGATHALQVNNAASQTRYVVVTGSNGSDPIINASAGAILFGSEIKLNSANTVSASVATASTNKIMMVVNGTTYYLLATTVP